MKQLLERFDEGVQKVVDAGMFFVMRTTGATKSFIRYGINAAIVLCAIAVAVIGVQVPPVRWWELMFYAGAVAISLLNQRFEQKREKLAEERGLIDPRVGSWSKPLWWFLLGWSTVEVILGIPGDGAWKACPALWAIRGKVTVLFDAVVLLAAYSARTPPTPPPKKRARREVLVPARSQS
jgi:hypothetical protein